MKIRVDSGCLYFLSIWMGLGMVVLSICAFCNEEYFTIGMAIGFLIFGLLCLLPTIIKLIMLIVEFSPSKKPLPKTANNHYSSAITETHFDVTDAQSLQSMGIRNEFLYEKMDDILSHLNSKGGTRFITDINADEAGQFIISICENMLHAPSVKMLNEIYLVSSNYFDDIPSITYTFHAPYDDMGQLIYVFLVKARKKIRFFTLEKSPPYYAICEYSGNSHYNYGQVKPESIHTKIKEILLKTANQNDPAKQSRPQNAKEQHQNATISLRENNSEIYNPTDYAFGEYSLDDFCQFALHLFYNEMFNMEVPSDEKELSGMREGIILILNTEKVSFREFINNYDSISRKYYMGGERVEFSKEHGLTHVLDMFSEYLWEVRSKRITVKSFHDFLLTEASTQSIYDKNMAAGDDLASIVNAIAEGKHPIKNRMSIDIANRMITILNLVMQNEKKP